MPITRDVRAMLAANAVHWPDTDNTLAAELAEAWLAKKVETKGPHVRRSTAPFFASDGAGCARRASYDYLHRVLPDESPDPQPKTITDEWRFTLGEMVHDMIQEVAPSLGYENEVRAVLQDADGNDLVSTRADLVRIEDGTVVEIKSATGFKFKKAATTFSGDPEGPSYAHVVQLAMTVKALVEQEKVTVHRGVILWPALEVVAPYMVDITRNEIGRFMAQWSFTVEELIDIADEIIAHLAKIKMTLEAGDLPPRVIKDPEVPSQAVVTNTTNGKWEVKDRHGTTIGSGRTWMCNYCDWQDLCTDALRVELGQ